MPLLQWSPWLSVGIQVFDDEHVTLIAMMNELFDSMQTGHGKDALGRILDGLVAYTQTHFTHEERVMSQHGFPGYARHKDEHDALTRHVLAIQARYRAGATATLTLDVMTFLKDWLVHHVQGSDKGYAAFLTRHGVS